MTPEDRKRLEEIERQAKNDCNHGWPAEMSCDDVEWLVAKLRDTADEADTLSAELAARRANARSASAREQRLTNALIECVDRDPMIPSECGGDPSCYFCGGDGFEGRWHESECPWVDARKLIGFKEPEKT